MNKHSRKRPHLPLLPLTTQCCPSQLKHLLHLRAGIHIISYFSSSQIKFFYLLFFFFCCCCCRTRDDQLSSILSKKRLIFKDGSGKIILVYCRPLIAIPTSKSYPLQCQQKPETRNKKNKIKQKKIVTMNTSLRSSS